MRLNVYRKGRELEEGRVVGRGRNGRGRGGEERGREGRREGKKGREGRMWETGRCGQGEVEGEGDGIGIYVVPFTLTFGHYDLVSISLTTLVIYISSPFSLSLLQSFGDIDKLIVSE